MAAPLQVTVAVEGGIEPHRLAEVIRWGFAAVHQALPTVTVGQGQYIDGIPVNTILVTNVDRP